MRNISHVVRVVTESSVVKNALAALVMVSMRMLEHSIILCPDKNTRSWCSRHPGQAGKDTALDAGSCSKCVNIRVRSGYSIRCWLLGCTLISGSGYSIRGWVCGRMRLATLDHRYNDNQEPSDTEQR